jgi:hypothetical protein
MKMNHRKTLLIISQTFVPDPASVGQHMADVAVEMARRGHRVLVYTSARGYENPNVRYPRRENLHGVQIRRFGLASFGKKTILLRVLGTASFMLQAIWVVLTTPDLGGIFFSTSPPLIGIAAMIGRRFRRVPIAYWAMDLNPDQLIAMKKIEPGSFVARALEYANRLILRDSSLVVALDRFMAERLRNRPDVLESREANLAARRDRSALERKLMIAPPWPHEAHLEQLPHEQNPFRAKYGLGGRFVIMYSGNHSPANPLRTLLEAALKLKEEHRIKFLFIGGGLGKQEVEGFALEHCLRNVISLPYQPMSELKYSLSAADVHVVSLGQEMVGIVHPCKIYGAMSVGRPILFFGPRPSHVADILDENMIGRQVEHGDVTGAVEAIRAFAEAPSEMLARMGRTAQHALAERFTETKLCGEFCDRLEEALKLRSKSTASEPGRLRSYSTKATAMRRTAIATLLLLGVALTGLSCQKDVREVRRDALSPETPGGNASVTHRGAPEAPSGNPVSISGAPVAP